MSAPSDQITEDFNVLTELNALQRHFELESAELLAFNAYLDRHHNEYLEELRLRNDQHNKIIAHLQTLHSNLENLSGTVCARVEDARRSSAARLESRVDDLNTRLSGLVQGRETKIQEGLSQLNLFQEQRLSTWKLKLEARKAEHGKLEDQKRQLVARPKNIQEISDSSARLDS